MKAYTQVILSYLLHQKLGIISNICENLFTYIYRRFVGHVTRVCVCVLVSGGYPAGLPQHLQDHGLRGLLQVSTLGEAAGEHALTTHSERLFGYLVIYRPVLISFWADAGIRDLAEDFVFRATNRSSARVRRPATRVPAESAGDRLPVQRLRKVIETVGNVLINSRTHVSFLEQKLCESPTVSMGTLAFMRENVVSLDIHRISTSIRELQNFRELLAEEQ